MAGIKGRGGQKGRSGTHTNHTRNGGRQPITAAALGRQIDNLFQILSQKYPGAKFRAESIAVEYCPACGKVYWEDWEIDAFRDGKLVGVEPVVGVQHKCSAQRGA